MLKYIIMGILGFQTLLTTLPAANTETPRESAQEMLQSFSEAFNQGKVDKLAAFWTPDAELALPATGEIINGREAIAKYLEKRSQEIKTRNLTFTFKPLKSDFSKPDEAFVEGLVEITNKEGLLQRNARRIELIKQNGQWLIDSVKEIEVPPGPPTDPHLNELGWFVGNWHDTDEDVEITFNAHWDKYHNFILQHFKMVVYSVDVIEGMQIIGWDPVDKAVRSWIYDSDGGFGTGLWTKNGDTWSAKMNFVFRDGSKGTATNIYTKKDDHSYQFSSTDRKIGDQSVASIEPITVVKEE